MYTQYYDEHMKGHHKTVSTPLDPATSRKNEWIHSFIPRSIIGSMFNVWGYEYKRIVNVYGKDASLVTRVLCNKMLWYQILHVSI